MTKLKRCLVSMPEDLVDDIQAIKKAEYFNRPHTDLYRDLMKLGLSEWKKGNRGAISADKAGK